MKHQLNSQTLAWNSNVRLWPSPSMDKEGCKLDEKPLSYDEYSTTFLRGPRCITAWEGVTWNMISMWLWFLSKDWVATKNLHDRLSLKDKANDAAGLRQIDIINIHVDENRTRQASFHQLYNMPSSSTSTSLWKWVTKARTNIPKNSKGSQKPKTCSAPCWIQGFSNSDSLADQRTHTSSRSVCPQINGGLRGAFTAKTRKLTAEVRQSRERRRNSCLLTFFSPVFSVVYSAVNFSILLERLHSEQNPCGKGSPRTE